MNVHPEHPIVLNYVQTILATTHANASQDIVCQKINYHATVSWRKFKNLNKEK